MQREIEKKIVGLEKEVKLLTDNMNEIYDQNYNMEEKTASANHELTKTKKDLSDMKEILMKVKEETKVLKQVKI